MAWFILLSGILNLFLGLIVWLRDLKNRLNLGFGIFSLSTVVLILFDFFFRFNPTVFVLKSSYAFAALVPVTALVWILEMCRINVSKFSLPRRVLIFLPGLIFFLLPYIDSLIVVQVHSLTLLGYTGQLGPLFALYALYFFVYILAFIILLYRAQRKAVDRIYKIQIRFVLAGIMLYSLTALTSSLILPKFFGVFDFTLLDAPSLIFFVGFTAYAILKLHLFNIKVIATELLVFTLSIFILIRTILSESLTDQLTNGGLLVSIIIIGTFLIRSVIKEVRQREKIEKLAKELEEANRSQENFIHLFSHEVKGGLGKANAVFSEIAEGSYDADQKLLKETAGLALKDNRKVVKQVEDVLNSANFKTGKVTYDMKSFDFKEALLESVNGYRSEAEAKGLKLEVRVKDGENYLVNGDRGLIVGHLFKNLIENAINFTPLGDIKIDLSKANNKIGLAVKDTGVGITSEDKAKLFTEGGHGKDSQKVNVHSTGYGLFITKQIVEAHRGKIWAESEGASKGSIFFVELPAS